MERSSSGKTGGARLPVKTYENIGESSLGENRTRMNHQETEKGRFLGPIGHSERRGIEVFATEGIERDERNLPLQKSARARYRP